MSARTYLKNTYEKIFAIMLKNYRIPIKNSNHSEIDGTDFLDLEGISKYQMFVICMQWAITIGKFDIQYATNTITKFSNALEKRHMRRMLRIFGYLKHHSKYQIAFNIQEPNYQGLKFVDPDWNIRIWKKIYQRMHLFY